MSKEISLPLTFRDKAIVFRGGGLGDFILTLPLLSHIQNSYREVFFLTKPAYFFLVNKRNGLPELFDLAHGLSQISKKIEGADIFTFWDDIEWKDELQNLGANQIFILASRPTEGSHIVRVMFEKMNTPFLPSILSNAWIGDDWSKNSNMWIHPGSGGEYKNMPFSFYKNLAETWLKKKSSNLVTFCFGEADWKIFKTFEETKFLFSGRIKYVQPSSVEEYKSNLREGVFEFWGNDSGPGHLAANLGIPINICFRSTNSSIWRPTGPRVNIHEFQEDSI